MNALTIFLSLAIFASAFMNIRANYADDRPKVYLFKPLTTSLIIVVALFAQSPPSPTYQWLIVVGLLFSLAGDIFLMLPTDRFLFGLVSFLVAHVFYIAAFWGSAPAGFTTTLVTPLIIYGLLVAMLLLPHVSQQLRPAVVIYILVILIMVWRAIEQWVQLGSFSATLALIGASLFAISDSALALNRFRSPFHAAQLIVLSTYFAAQWLIALSVWGF